MTFSWPLYFIRQGIPYYQNLRESMYSHLNVVGEHSMIPREAFLFKPKQEHDPEVPDDFRRFEGGQKFRRLIFDGWAQETYTPLEKEKLEEFDRHVKENGVDIDELWSRPWRLRWLLSTGYDMEKTVREMYKYEGYQIRVRQLSLTHKVAEFLKMGMFYMVGRDSHYRPIIVIDVEKIVQSKITEEECLRVQTYFFEYIMRHCFIPGQVESWVAIIDSNYQSMSDLLGAVKAAFAFLSDTYRMRITLTIRMIWAVVQKFLDPETVNKILLFEDLIPTPLFQIANKSQFQQKFGGNLPDRKEGDFWPPVSEVSSDYSVTNEKIKLMTPQEYTSNYENNIIYETRINEDLLIKKQSSEFKENPNKKKMRELEKCFGNKLDQIQTDKFETTFEMQRLSKFQEPLDWFQLLKKGRLESESTLG